MQISKAFRFRLYPTAEQAATLDGWSDALRFLWNLAHEQRLMAYAHARCDRRYLTAFDQIRELTALRADLPWLAAVPRNVSAQLLVELDHAWQRCFKGLARQPRWKRKGRDVVSLSEPHPKVWRLGPDELHFPKLGGPLRVIVHRPLEGTPKTCTITRDGDQWFAAIVCVIERAAPAPRTEPVVALDRGIINFVGDSDGHLVANPRHLQRATRRLAHSQRVVARRVKGSRNRDKAKLRVARLHRKVRRQRDDFVHRLSHRYANSHGRVIVERLNLQGMVRNHHLARAILDAGWGRFVQFLRYKLDWTGGSLVEVRAAYSSQECAACGYVSAANRVSQARFRCQRCGHEDHADLNAAKVLRSRGNHGGAACGGSAEVRRPAKQELRVVRRGTRSRQGLGSKAPAFRPG